MKETSFTLNTTLIKRFYNLFKNYIWRSWLYWFGLVLLGAAAGFHSWISALMGEYMGQFYVVAVEENNNTGITNTILLMGATMIGLSFEQALTKTITSGIALQVRLLLTHGIHSKYFSKLNYYKLSLISKMKNMDQQLTQDIDKFSSTFSQWLTEIIASPVFIIYFWIKVHQEMNWYTPVVIAGFYLLSYIIQRFIMSPISHRTYIQEKLEGEYRNQQQKVKEFSESIALSAGGSTEYKINIKIFTGFYLLSYIIQRFIMSPISHRTYIQEKLEGEYRNQQQKVKEFSESIALSAGGSTEYKINIKIFTDIYRTRIKIILWEFLLWMMSYVFSYGATVLGYVMISLPVFLGEQNKLDSQYISVVIYDIGMLAWGFTKIATIATTVAEFCGYLHRVGEIVEYLDEVDESSSPSSLQNSVNQAQSITINDSSVKSGIWNAEQMLIGVASDHHDDVRFEKVSVFDPEKRLVLKDVSFVLDQNILIMGPTGSGKTSLIRTLAGLWACHSGRIHIPQNQKVVFVPQKVYLPNGNLKQQIVYPLYYNEEQPDSIIQNEEALALLKKVGLEKLINYYGQSIWEHTNWDFLSPGQRQKLVIARLLFHSPSIVILDEISSQVDNETETNMYELLHEKGTIMLSVGHRSTLEQYHDKIFDVVGENLIMRILS
eukprot:TRINITY_DN6003_c0_g1_i1.p1 TRINITY_DN6003_c0_g1~~TRINITY_DN6003_c0_g1_i1.p1  ORF type:complete len:662 (+),score=86.56 TRINITY_DN6003_c0_g1_i1:45-2030(+)